MPTTPTYPGVYIEELENPVKTIVGVSTSVTAFVGRAYQGPVDDPILIHNFGEFESIYGGLWKKSTMSYAVFQYFLNGGKDAIIVRVFKGDVDASKTKFAGAGTTLKFEARDPGKWAESYSVKVDYNVDDTAPDTADLFNVRVLSPAGAEIETFLNLSWRSDHKRYAVNVIEEKSTLIRIDKTTVGALTTRPPAAVYSADGSGSDGSDIGSTELTGDRGAKTGLYALEDADIFNLLCIPPPDAEGADEGSPHYSAVYTAADAYCKERRAMLIVDPPTDWSSANEAKAGIGSLGLARSENAAIYFPRIRAADPKEEYRLRPFAPCGVVAGIVAKTDAQRGVWKAPAGIEAILVGVPELEYSLTDNQNGDLNPLGINCLRTMSPAGRIVWGARTLKGADNLANQWKYLPVRRTALYIEETLYRNTKWAVFEPNDEPLWSQLRLSIGAFMHDLFIKGAFQGSTPKEAYLVKCDRETTTQYDIDRGIVNIVVGFAPLKPAEFVIIKIQQLAGQAEAQ